jgi:hypothetical protein
MPHSPFFRLVHDDDAKIAKGYTSGENFVAIGFLLLAIGICRTGEIFHQFRFLCFAQFENIPFRELLGIVPHRLVDFFSFSICIRLG